MVELHQMVEEYNDTIQNFQLNMSFLRFIYTNLYSNGTGEGTPDLSIIHAIEARFERKVC